MASALSVSADLHLSSERKAAPVNFRDYLSLARTLAGGMTEAEWRSASSRAYYAAFHVARLLLLDLGFRVPQADRAHGYLYYVSRMRAMPIR